MNKYYNCGNKFDDLLRVFLEMYEVYPVITNSTHNGTVYKYVWDKEFQELKEKFYGDYEFTKCVKVVSREYAEECINNGQELLSIRRNKEGRLYYILNKKRFSPEECILSK